MYTLCDYLYTFQNRLLSSSRKEAENDRIGKYTDKSKEYWLILGMQLAAGRLYNLIEESKLLQILNTIRLYASVTEMELYPGSGCVYQYQKCYNTRYVQKLTDITDSEMIERFYRDELGNLVLKTNKQTFTVVPAKHNQLQDIQGGVDWPGIDTDERYHLSKSMYDSLEAAAFVEATSSFSLTPSAVLIGNTFTPELTIGYAKNDDTVLSHTLTKNGVAVNIQPVSQTGVFLQTIHDTLVHTPMPLTYVYTVNRQNKPPLILTRAITYQNQVFYGAISGTVSNVEILSASYEAQYQGVILLLYTSNQQLLWVAYPKAWGRLKSVLDSLNNELLPAFTQGQYPETRALTIGSESIEYYLYVNNLTVDVSNFQLRYLV